MVSYVASVALITLWCDVLILIVMEDGLVHNYERYKEHSRAVLILIVMEDGLVPVPETAQSA